jgi:mono/diheme cytochrome c family protein
MQAMPNEHGKQIAEKRADQRLGSPRLCIALFSFILLLAPIMLSACASPQVSAAGPTPIPTLIPATMAPSQIEPTSTPPLILESFPAGIPSAADGQVLYAEYCTECHGADGEGQVPGARNFGDVDYMRGETPLNFYLAITEGVAGPAESQERMPSFSDELTSDQRWDLVYYVWRFATTDERLATGKEIYTAFCQECHGPDGRSQILDAADLSDQRFIAHQSPSDLYLSVTRGRGSMPAWQARLSQDERWMVIEYLRTFSYDPALNEAITPTEEPPEEEAQLACDPTYLDQTNPFAWDDAQAIGAGEPIYLRECVDCHGEDGTGEIAQAPDFTNPVMHGELTENSGEALCRVSEGINRMPAFKDTLTEDEIWQVLTYIASLAD